MTHLAAPESLEPPTPEPPNSRLERMTPSAIREVHNLGESLKAEKPDGDYIPLHFGEGDLGTPEFIVEAGIAALRDGAVYYENNGGRPDLVAQLVRHYESRLGVALTPQHFVITCGGVQAILLTMLGLVVDGDDVINITPAWPNFREGAVIAGAAVHDLPLQFDQGAGAFRLEMGRLKELAARLERPRVVIANTPANPTGYLMTPEEKRELLAFCREREITLLADEMYDRIVFAEEAGPSFLQLAEAADRLVVINGFSKTYAMTGWRLGYLIAEPRLAVRLAGMQEFVTSCAPAMAQVAAITALRDGESYVEESRQRYRGLRDLVLERLRAIPGVTVAQPDGAFYVFFRAPGSEESLAFCKGLLLETGVSLAPGAAFGGGGEGWLRLCFAKEPALLHEALDRLEAFVANRRS